MREEANADLVRVHEPNRLKTRALIDSRASNPILRDPSCSGDAFSKKFRGVPLTALYRRLYQVFSVSNPLFITLR